MIGRHMGEGEEGARKGGREGRWVRKWGSEGGREREEEDK